jgi:hypothetical protein
MAVQSGDPCQQGDAAAAVLAREKADEEPSGPFIRRSHQAVDPAMLPRHRTMAVLLTGRALTAVENLRGLFLSHTTFLPEGDLHEGQGHCIGTWAK